MGVAAFGLSYAPTSQILSNMGVTIPYISIKPGYFAMFSRPEWDGRSRTLTAEERDNLRKNGHQGKVSRKARRRISGAIDWLLYLAKDKTFVHPTSRKKFTFRLNFITLTLASKQIHSDQVIKAQLLNQFLVEMRRDFKLNNYVWRAEAQTNGNIHFHVVSDRFVPWSVIRKSWNRIQNKLGYVDRYREEMKAWHKNGFQVRKDLLKTWSLDKQKQAYKSGMKGNWSDPNSTDIHSIYKIRNLSAYLSKYFTKEGAYRLKQTGESKTYLPTGEGSQREFTINCVELEHLYRPINGKLWGLSNSLSKLKSIVLEVTYAIHDEIGHLYKRYKDRFRFDTYYSVAYVQLKEWMSDKYKSLKRAFNEQLADVMESGTDKARTLNLFSSIPPPKPEPVKRIVQGELFTQTAYI